MRPASSSRMKTLRPLSGSRRSMKTHGTSPDAKPSRWALPRRALWMSTPSIRRSSTSRAYASAAPSPSPLSSARTSTKARAQARSNAPRMIGELTGLRSDGTRSPRVPVVASFSPRAIAFGWYCSSRAASRIRCRVSGRTATSPLLLITRETVERCTPATRATSSKRAGERRLIDERDHRTAESRELTFASMGAIEQDILAEALRVTDGALAAEVQLRVVGGVAVGLHTPEGVHPALARPYRDI